MAEAKSKPLVFLEYGLLAVCLAVIAVRCVFTEGVNLQSTAQTIRFDDSVYSLLMSGLLISAFVVWFVCSFCSERFLYRFTGIEIGLCLFFVAGVAAGLAAEDKRAAITSFTIMLAPVLMAVLLVQMLDSAKKAKLLLAVIVSVGVVAALYCASQFLWINDIIIEQYRNNPRDILEQLGIRDGSFKQMLFENSLKSKDVRGFFTTGNSAGSFALLACFAAVALFLEKVKNRKANVLAAGEAGPVSPGLVAMALAAAIIVFGLIITHSKGAIGTSLIAAVMFVTYLCFGGWLKTHKKAILTVCVLSVVVVGCAVVVYGLTNDRLPGGNSMLVRWQYWCASGQMYADHPVTGVGSGNFVHFYPRYKPASALESVADPHNFLLGIITQYGPLGLIGFLAAVFIPLGRTIFTHSVKSKQNNVIIAALFCAIVAFLVHNCIDFAIFEGGVLTAFWAIMAAVIALDFGRKHRPQFILKPAVFAKVIAAAGGVIIIFAFLACALVPVMQSGTKIRQARQASSDGWVERAHSLLADAAEDDRLSAVALSINGRLYLQRFYSQPIQNRNLLLKSEKCLLDAIERNKASFKNFEKLTEVYLRLAETSWQQSKTVWLNKAFDSSQQAVARYPGCGRLRIKLAQIAEQLEKTGLAAEQYRQAIDIEDSYREQFRIMYPGRKIFSRLGQQSYELARQRISELKCLK